MILVDTSLLVLVEKQREQAIALVSELLASGELALSTVTAHELLRSPRLPDAWRAFWLDFFGSVHLLDLDLDSAEAAAAIWSRARRKDGARRLDVGDVLIAGTAEAAGIEAVTDDDGFAELASARIVRPS